MCKVLGKVELFLLKKMEAETYRVVACWRPVELKALGSIVVIPKSLKSNLEGHPDPQSDVPVIRRVPLAVKLHVQPPHERT